MAGSLLSLLQALGVAGPNGEVLGDVVTVGGYEWINPDTGVREPVPTEILFPPETFEPINGTDPWVPPQPPEDPVPRPPPYSPPPPPPPGGGAAPPADGAPGATDAPAARTGSGWVLAGAVAAALLLARGRR